MDTSEMRVLLQGAAKIFKAGLKSKTWDIHGMPQFITTTHCEGCETCDAYALHIIKASESSTVEIPSSYNKDQLLGEAVNDDQYCVRAIRHWQLLNEVHGY